MKPKRRSRTVLKVVLAIVAVMMIGGFFGWRALRSPPVWFNPPDATSAEVQRLADRVEYAIIEKAHDVRPDDQPWRVRIRDEQVNAWLAARLPEWVEHDRQADWPDELGTLQVKSGADGMQLAIELRRDGASQFVVVTLQPSVRDDQLWLRADRVAVGRLNLPGDPAEVLNDVLDRHFSNEREHPELRYWLDVLSGRQGIGARIPLADHRSLSMQNIKMEDGAFVLQARTLMGGDGEAATSPPELDAATQK